MTESVTAPVTDAAEGTTGEGSWHDGFAYFKDNPEGRKAFGKYKTVDEAFKGAHEAMKRMGKPYHLPDDPKKLTAEQRGEIDAWHRKSRGVPDAPEGYQFEFPEDALIDEQAIGDFRKLAHERGVDPETAQNLLNIQISLGARLNGHREKIIQGMTDNNYKTFLNDDCGGDKDLATARQTLVKQYLQSQFVGKNGEPDTAGWEKFAARNYYKDRLIELPFLRALYEPAQMKMGTGGAPGSSGREVLSGPGLYAEMRKR